MNVLPRDSEPLSARIGSMGLVAPLPGARRRGDTHAEPYQIFNIWGIAPGISASCGPAYVDLSLPAGPHMPRWQAGIGLQLAQALRLPQLMPLGAPGAQPLKMLDFIGARMEVWGNKQAIGAPSLLPTGSSVTKALPVPLCAEPLGGGHSEGRQYLCSGLWGLAEVGVLVSRQTRFERARPLDEATTLAKPSLLLALEAGDSPAPHRTRIFAQIWERLVYLWQLVRGGAALAALSVRGILASGRSAQSAFSRQMQAHIAELPDNGELAGALLEHARKRILFAAPLLAQAKRLPEGVRRMLRWPALQVRADVREEQRYCVIGAERVLDLRGAPPPADGDAAARRFNVVLLNHAVRASDGQLAVRTMRLPIYFESQLSTPKVATQHVLNVEVMLAAPHGDKTASRRALEQLSATLLSPAQAQWRRNLLADKVAHKLAQEACADLDAELTDALADLRAQSSIKRLEIVQEQLLPQASLRVESEVWPTAALLPQVDSKLLGERTIVEPHRALLLRESFLRRAEQTTLPRLEDDGTGELAIGSARFDYEVVLRTYPNKTGSDRVAGLGVRFQLVGEKLDPTVVNFFCRKVNDNFADNPFGRPQHEMQLHPQLQPDKRRMLLTVDFTPERLARAHHLLARFEADELRRERGEAGFFWGRTLHGVDLTNEPSLQLRERMKQPLELAMPAVAEALGQCSYDNILVELGRLWRLGICELIEAAPSADCALISDSGLYEATLQKTYAYLKRFETRRPTRPERRELRLRAKEVVIQIEKLPYETLMAEGVGKALRQRLRRLFDDIAAVLDVAVIEKATP